MAWKPDYVTLAELKNFMHIFDTDDDASLALDITAASRAVDNHCNRQFGKTDALEQRLYTAEVRDCRWVVDIDDLMTVTGLVVTITDVGTLTAFVKEPINAAQEARPWTRFVVDTTSTVKPTGKPYEVAITATWGWTATPVPVKEATRLQASRFAARRNSPYGVAGSPDQGSELRLLSRVDPDVGVSLRGFRRARKVG